MAPTDTPGPAVSAEPEDTDKAHLASQRLHYRLGPVEVGAQAADRCDTAGTAESAGKAGSLAWPMVGTNILAAGLAELAEPVVEAKRTPAAQPADSARLGRRARRSC